MKKTLLRIIPLLILSGTIIAGILQNSSIEKILSTKTTHGNMQNNDLYQYEILRSGAIKPTGWIADQLEADLNEGYIGSFDEVHHTVTHDVFVNQNRLSKRKFSMRKEWWSGEHEGYWKDAVIRMAFLTDDPDYKKIASDWVEDLISADESGYIGIYSDKDVKGSRFNHVRENGELWVTSRIVMALLAYYEYTGNQEVLEAAEDAVKLVMKNYKDENYFRAKSRGGGVSHGVGFFENLEWLYRITQKQSYLDFAKKLYHDFNNVEMRDDDLQTENLLNKEKKFDDHGAHIAEGLFIPHMISAIDSQKMFESASKSVLPTLDYHTTPSGAMRSDEWLKERKGTADEHYEYCGIAEMVSPLNKIISFSGDLTIGDRIEKMTFNAGQGARFPILKALAYFSKDNRIKINHNEIARRETYNAVHFAAACCVLNGARLMPYYVEGMWMAMPEKSGLAKILYGPSELNTVINGTKINIEENTVYPFNDEVEFIISPDEPVSFSIEFRKPFGCNALNLELPDNATLKVTEHSAIVDKKWNKGDTIKMKFNFDIKKVSQPESNSVDGKGLYIQRGPIVYSLPFDHTSKKVREHRNSGFYSYRLKVKDKTGWNYEMDPEEPIHFSTDNKKTMNNPWNEPVLYLDTKLINEKNKLVPCKLIPMGNTVFRRVTFPIKN